ncbi:MAG: hypothetical protein NZ739_01640 [Verrucomicrobiae bacterium]|nr:hypothetical protein [Verrucomicrobiae bacterium]MCX7722448.1 hypothetical protein [Verrucomicrobiae bacterium]MDW7980985.1 hypothetical protein [Verrucomicrobiales bacterium]
MRHSLAIHALIVCIACASLRAQTNVATAAPARKQSGRYLLIFDISAGMRSRAKMVEQTVSALITSGMQGELRPGDSIGVWTFNNRLHTGKFPLQEWAPDRADEIVARLAEFLQTRKYERKADWAEVMPRLNHVVRSSERLTVVLFSDASLRIHGTPFDAELNAMYAEHERTMKRTRAPFVTVLRAQRGRFIGASGTLAVWPIHFPPFTPEPEPASQTLTNRTATGTPSKPTATGITRPQQQRHRATDPPRAPGQAPTGPGARQ